ncbi:MULTISPECIES: alpha/beta hydrolase [unclassified Curtobacterium]|uniref:alpha/beta hydrolase n=1 Tax=unclassified Curtobacterium TaxID=257496 RepID=UPI000DA88F44|nr:MULTISPECIES: alpha/beta hydrolase [unclassified Curtobacterium]PZF39452.1 alpha/beta hydrolase [Curtobacterium sp. MCLR17_053]PZF48483.1 alpha/beta hydrolase [Curtobacterium sp. MCLR17_051]
MRSTDHQPSRSDTGALPNWRPDVLGPDYEAFRLDLEPDAEGPVVATLVRRTSSHRPPGVWSSALTRRSDRHPLGGADVLYVHGWSDYFFQQELAEHLQALGARFHAVDLRKYGRSLLTGQTPGYTDDLTVYDTDLEAALALMGHGASDRPRRRLLLLGHSTGGLTLALWAARHPGRAHGLVLNSPWLEFQASALGREVLTPLVKLGARRNPLAPMPVVDPGHYTRTVSSEAEGSWTYDQHWRPVHGFPLHPGWLAAVFAGQDTVARGLHLDIPVLVLLSTHSNLGPRWSDAMTHSDVALNVDAVAHRSLSLGDDVTVVRVHRALHDVMLSEPAVRDRAYVAIRRWARTIPLHG